MFIWVICSVAGFYPLRYHEMDGEYVLIHDYMPIFDDDCKKFVAEDGNAYYEGTILFRGSRGAWHMTLDLCSEYKSTGDIPKQLQFSPVSRPVLPIETLKNAFSTCCSQGRPSAVSQFAFRRS